MNKPNGEIKLKKGQTVHDLLRAEMAVLVPLEKKFKDARAGMRDFVLKKVVPRVASRSGKYKVHFNLAQGKIILEDITPKKIHLLPWKRRHYR